MLVVEKIIDAVKNPNIESLITIKRDFADYLQNNNPEFNQYPDIKSISFLFDLYDKHYFDSALRGYYQIRFDFSFRLTRAAAITKFYHNKKDILMSFSYPLIFHKFMQNDKQYEVNGILCDNPRSALMRVMEHEIVHIMEIAAEGKSSCGKLQFKKLCYHLFRHTDTKHKLCLEPANTQNQKMKYQIGEQVKFTHKDKDYVGELVKITKRATVLVRNSQDKLTGKFYVPLNLLNKIIK